MALPTPIPGLVLRYSYLWHREHVDGVEEGRKDRPCAIVASVRTDKTGETRVLVLPITHRDPCPGASAIALPSNVKQRLGLDSERSWVILSEWNEFRWPGPDLRRIPGAPGSAIAYGVLPPRLFSAVRDRFVALVKSRQSRPVPRD